MKNVFLLKTDITKNKEISISVLEKTPKYLINLYKLVVNELLSIDTLQDSLKPDSPLCAFIFNFEDDVKLPEKFDFESLFKTEQFKNMKVEANFMLNIDSKKHTVSVDFVKLVNLFNTAINAEISSTLAANEN